MTNYNDSDTSMSDIDCIVNIPEYKMQSHMLFPDIITEEKDENEFDNNYVLPNKNNH